MTDECSMKRSGTRKATLAIILLAALHAIVVTGLVWDQTSTLFRQIVPFYFLASAAILLIFHRPWDKRSMLILSILFIASWGVAVAGADTGKIFGELTYGDGLGPKLSSAPLAIGLVWLMLVYGTAHVVWRANIKAPWMEVTGAGMITFIDYLMEPVANTLGWWSRDGGSIPLLNFIAWFYISFAFLFLFFRYMKIEPNEAAIPLLAFQTMFFTVLNIIWFMKP